MPEANEVCCANCGAFINQEDPEYRLSDGTVLCQRCWEEDTNTCAECNTVHLDGNICTVRGEGREPFALCLRCYNRADTDTCDSCGEIYYADSARMYLYWEGPRLRESTLCTSCASQLPSHHAFEECEGCSRYISNSVERCECGSENPNYTVLAAPSEPRGYTSVGGYHNPNRRISGRPSTDELCIGFEFEVVGSNVEAQWRGLAEQGIQMDQICPERDGTVDIEWVSAPIPMSQSVEFVKKVCRGLRAGGATAYDSSNSCGCHHNVDKNYLSEKQWGTVVELVTKWYELLSTFSGRGRRFSYCAPSLNIEQAKRCRGAVNFPQRRTNVVELRLPGMTLAPTMMATQVSLYYNMLTSVKNGATVATPFKELFSPWTEDMKKCIRRKGYNWETGYGIGVEPPTDGDTQATPGAPTFSRAFGDYPTAPEALFVRVRSIQEIAEYLQVEENRLPGLNASCPPHLCLTLGLTKGMFEYLYNPDGSPKHAHVDVSMEEGRVYYGLITAEIATERVEFGVRLPVLRIRGVGEDINGLYPSLLFDAPGMDQRIPQRLLSGSYCELVVDSNPTRFSPAPRPTETGSLSISSVVGRRKLSEDQLDEDHSTWDRSHETNHTYKVVQG